MQIRNRLKLPLPESKFDDLISKELMQYINSLAEAINGGLKFDDNFNCDIVTTANTGSADTQFSVTHDLKRIPTGFILIKSDKACSIYDSGTAWTATTIYLKCNVATCNITIIVI